MPSASCPPDVSDHAAFNVLDLNDGLRRPRCTFRGADESSPSRLPVIDQLFGVLIDVPPSAWLFV
jgi:hypothetical protein